MLAMKVRCYQLQDPRLSLPSSVLGPLMEGWGGVGHLALLELRGILRFPQWVVGSAGSLPCFFPKQDILPARPEQLPEPACPPFRNNFCIFNTLRINGEAGPRKQLSYL